MKKITYLLLLALGVTACSVESLDSTENLTVADAKMTIQSTVTINAPEGVLCADEVLPFSVTVNTTSNFQVQQLINGEWEQVYLANQGQTGSKSFNVVLAEGDNFFRYTNQGSGSNWTAYSTPFVGVNCDVCENSLVAELVCEETNSLVVTFKAEESGSIVIQGGLTNGTAVSSATAVGLTRNTTHPGVQNSNSNVTRWEGVVDACEEVSVTITFTGGDGIGDWSAKRGDDVLGWTEEQACQN